MRICTVLAIIVVGYLIYNLYFVRERFGDDSNDDDAGDPDSWSEGPILLPYDPKDRKRQREWPARERRRKEAEKRKRERERRTAEERKKRQAREKERRRKEHLGDPDHWGPGAGPIIL